MRITSTVTSLSWIPSEAVTGLNKMVFATGFTHYDDPPPDSIDDLEALRVADRFRYANELAGWIEVDDGRVVDAGYSGGSIVGSTTIAFGAKATFAATSFRDLQQPVELGGTSARFVQTVGGRTALPAPRRVNRPPFVQLQAPTIWTTLALTIHADGSVQHELIGASRFPRHWMYDADGALTAKAGLAEFKDWWRHSFGAATPWGDADSPALVTEAETALERELATQIMRGGRRPRIRRLKKGRTLTHQHDRGGDVFLLLDGVLEVEVDGTVVAEVGPGAIVGERAVLEGGRRTATVRAVTNSKVAVASADAFDRAAMAEVGTGHRREEQIEGASPGTAG